MNKYFISLTLTITLICGLIFAASYQTIRSNADDPQLQLVEDISEILAQGQPAEALNQQKQVDIRNSLATVIMVFDNQKAVLGSTALLNETQPTVSENVFSKIDEKGIQLFTWEPEKGVRLAAAMNSYQTLDGTKGYVIIARSLREVDTRIKTIGIMTGIGWISTILIASIPFALASITSKFNNISKSILLKKKVKDTSSQKLAEKLAEKSSEQSQDKSKAKNKGKSNKK